jgi:hypothetical protein
MRVIASLAFGAKIAHSVHARAIAQRMASVCNMVMRLSLHANARRRSQDQIVVRLLLQSRLHPHHPLSCR